MQEQSERLSSKKLSQLAPHSLFRPRHFHSLFQHPSHQLRCLVKVTLERKGREDISCSYEWVSNKLDWWLANNLDQIELSEVAFRLKLLTWKNQNPFLSSELEIPEIKYRWVRPGTGEHKEVDADDDESTKANRIPSWCHTTSRRFGRILNHNSFLCIVIPCTLIILLLVYHSLWTNIDVRSEEREDTAIRAAETMNSC